MAGRLSPARRWPAARKRWIKAKMFEPYLFV